MKTGVFYDNIKEAYPDIKDDLVLLEKVKELGFSCIELDCLSLAEKDGEFFGKALELSVGFTVYAFADENCILKNGRKAEDCLPFLAEHNVPNMMMVCMPRAVAEKTDANIRNATVSSLNSLCSEAEKYGISILAEDFDSNEIPCGSCEDMLFFAERVPKLKFTFDTGNFAFFGEDALVCFERLKNRIGHVHLKDRISADNLTVTVTGKGGLKLAEIIRRLTEINYGGILSVEMFGAAKSPADLEAAASFVKNAVRAIR